MSCGISVIVCCFNSASRLAPTLKHLVNQKKILLSSWEVIIIDNASTDATSEKASMLWQAHKISKPAFKVVSELKQGLSSARERGITEAQFDYVLFCDDDNWLDENYLINAFTILKDQPQIGAIGGIGQPIFEGQEPPYFWQNQFHTLAVGGQSKIEGDITNSRGVLYGAGLVLNKKAFNVLREDFSFHFLISDRIGDSLVSSGDHELCLALKKIGYRIFYTSKLRFQHFLPAYRTSLPYYRRLFLGFGISYAMLHVYSINKNNVYSLKNDYRYIILRCCKTIFTVQAELFIKGYYFSSNKYKYIDCLHELYNNIGILKYFITAKNLYQQQFASLPLFTKAV